MNTVTKNLGGRPPLPPGEKREKLYTFRVTSFEKDWLESVGNNTFWRYFDVTCAKILQGKTQYKQEDVTLEKVISVAKEIMLTYEQEET